MLTSLKTQERHKGFEFMHCFYYILKKRDKELCALAFSTVLPVKCQSFNSYDSGLVSNSRANQSNHPGTKGRN